MGTGALALDLKKLVLLFAWLLVLFVSLRAHTPWRDEYQSWLVSTRTPDLTLFFDAIRYERHPPLHYVLQRAAVTVFPGMLNWNPAHAIQMMTVPFAVGSALLLVFALGLPALQSGLLVFSPYFLREFSVISRCYSIGLFLLLSATALAQRKRYSYAYVLLGLGALTHLLFSWICGALFVLLALEDRRRWRDLTFYLSGLILTGAALLQIPPTDGLFPSSPALNFKTIYLSFKQLNQSLWGLEKIWLPYRWNTMPMATDLAIIFFILALVLIHRRLSLGKFLWVCLPPVFLVASSYGGSTRYLGVAFFGFVACFLIFNRPSPQKLNPLTLFSSVAVLSTAGWWLSWAPWKTPPKFDFSGAREMIAATEIEVSKGTLIVKDETQFFTWVAESQSPVYSMRRDAPSFYPHFKKADYTIESAEEWCRLRLSDFSKARPGQALFFGTPKGTPFPPACGKAEKIFSTQRQVLTDEDFDIYRLVND